MLIRKLQAPVGLLLGSAVSEPLQCAILLAMIAGFTCTIQAIERK